MSLLKPIKSTEIKPLVTEHRILSETGILPKSDEMVGILENYGLGKANLTMNLSNLVANADKDATKLAAIRTGLELHGLLLGEKSGNGNTQIIFELKSDKIQLNQIFAPQRAESQ